MKSVLSGWLMFLVLLKDGTQDEPSRGRDLVIIKGVGYNAANGKVGNFIAVLSRNSTPIP